KYHVCRVLSPLLAPEKVEAAVTVGDVIVLAESEPARGAVDPSRGAFEFEVDSNRSLIQHGHAAARRFVELRAVLLVAKERQESEACENSGEACRVGNCSLRFLAALVSARTGLALVGKGRLLPGFANAQQAAG